MSYSFESTVRYSECDQNGELAITSLVNYLQDCSTFHTESIGHGIRHCADLGFAWFVAAWNIQIERRPRFCDHICVTTWCSAPKQTMAHRYFLIQTTDGEPLLRVDSLWFPFDVQKGRPMRIPESERSYLDDENLPEVMPAQRKLTLEGNPTSMPSLTVTSHLLDTNHHVNNAQYIAIADEVVRSVQPDFVASGMLVQYKQAAKLGDTMVPRLYAEASGYAVELASETGTTFAVVRMQR